MEDFEYSTEDKYAEERERLIEGDPIVVVDELLALRAEVKTLRAKLKSGVEAAHGIQKDYFEGNSIDTHHLSSMDDAAYLILEAMGEPRYMTA